jgi:hypothetical protein
MTNVGYRLFVLSACLLFAPVGCTNGATGMSPGPSGGKADGDGQYFRLTVGPGHSCSSYYPPHSFDATQQFAGDLELGGWAIQATTSAFGMDNATVTVQVPHAAGNYECGDTISVAYAVNPSGMGPTYMSTTKNQTCGIMINIDDHGTVTGSGTGTIASGSDLFQFDVGFVVHDLSPAS